MARRQIRTLTPTELARVQQGVLVRIVDDDASLRDALRFVLETEGWRVVDYRKLFKTPIFERWGKQFCLN